MPRITFEEFNNMFDMFAFASWEFINTNNNEITIEIFKKINKVVKQTVERMAHSRSIKMKSLNLEQRIDIWPERLEE